MSETNSPVLVNLGAVPGATAQCTIMAYDIFNGLTTAQDERTQRVLEGANASEEALRSAWSTFRALVFGVGVVVGVVVRSARTKFHRRSGATLKTVEGQ